LIDSHQGDIPAFPVYIFDIDGTLLDSAADLCGAVRQVLFKHIPEPPPPEHFKRFIGYHLDEFFLDVLPHFAREQLDELIVEWRKVYPARGHAETRVYPGVTDLLEHLPGRKTTATTKGSAAARAVLDQFGLLPFFDHVQGTDGFGYKPKPDVILHAISALNAKPEDCLFVGDSETDMEAGRRAGVKVCAVRYGYGNPEALAKWNPDYWISCLTELQP
jgi:phosphoglycolate phosphatase